MCNFVFQIALKINAAHFVLCTICLLLFFKTIINNLRIDINQLNEDDVGVYALYVSVWEKRISWKMSNFGWHH